MIQRLQSYDFSPLSMPRPDYAQQTSISIDRRMLFMSALMHYNFHAASVIRYSRGNYTNDHLSPHEICESLTGIVPAHILSYVRRALVTGAPSQINGHSSLKNFNTYFKYGNHSTIHHLDIYPISNPHTSYHESPREDSPPLQD